MRTPSRGTQMPLVLWIIVFCGSGVCAGKRHTDADDSGSESVSRARCVSRCLSLHSVAAPLTPLQGNGSLGWCHRNKLCSQCLEPCKDDWKMKKRSNCRELCEQVFPEKQRECTASCEFLHSALAVKQGSCPPPEGASGFAAACIESCDRDKECSMQKKCCFNGCGRTCQSPKDPYKGVPLKPKKDLSFEEFPSGHLKVRWLPRSNISVEPVIYILQRRWNFGIQPSEDTATPWEVETQTAELEARLPDTRPGRWYQFRVAAVNLHGTRGFTTPSKHIHSKRDPSSPPAPSELRVANMDFGPGRLASATIIWDIPTDLDIPIHHYKVSWSWTAVGHSSASSMTKRRKTVRENQVELTSMRSNRKYTVEVQGVSYWRQTELKGPKAVLHFITQQTFSSTPPNPKGDILDVGTPFYQDGQLRVHVYWQSSTDSSVEFYRLQWGPEHCAHNLTKPMEKTRTRKNVVNLQGLLFSCKYKVLLQPVSSKSRPLAESTSFMTPSCTAIQAKSPKPIKCLGEAAVLPENIQMKAVNLTASFKVHGDNVSASFSWDLTMSPSNQQLIGYQVTWVEVIPTKRHSNRKLPHSLISQSQILPPEGNVLAVSGLHPASVYRLEVRVITAEGEGPASSRTFQTPGYQSIPKQRFWLRSDRHIKPITARH